MSKVTVRELSKEDWKLYKGIRLRSLKDSPGSFVSTYELECGLTDKDWTKRIDVNSRVANALPLIAELNDIAVGITCGVIHSLGEQSASVYQMWVDPEQRGQGIGALLLNRIIKWAEAAKMDNLELSVTMSNAAAVKLYQDAGFLPIGELEPLRKGSSLRTQNMILKIGS